MHVMKRLGANGAALWALVAIGALGRLPLLFRGYGSDDDAWRNVVAAIRTHDVGHYVPSRIPGFPVYEGFLFLLCPLGWVATNALSILAGAAAAYLLARIAERLGIAHSSWVGLVFFMSTPLWVDSSQTMDYALGVMLFLLAYYALVAERWALSSLALGLAAGSRITLGFMIVPALLFLLCRRESPARILRYGFVFGVTLLLVYLPMILSPEARILSAELKAHVVKNHATLREIPGLARHVAVFLLTKPGLLVLFAALIIQWVQRFLRRGERPRRPRANRDGWRRTWPVSPAGVVFEFAGISLLTIFFLLVPYESAYLLPALPLGLLILGRFMPRYAFSALSIAMLLSIFVTPYVDARRLAPGRIFEELELRDRLLDRTERLGALRGAAPTIYLVPRFEIHRLLVLDKELAPTDAAWAPFRASGVALWSSDKTRGFASDLTPEERGELESQGYVFERPRL